MIYFFLALVNQLEIFHVTYGCFRELAKKNVAQNMKLQILISKHVHSFLKRQSKLNSLPAGICLNFISILGNLFV